MKKLILMQGLPASGKSTKAKELVAAGAVRINKDLLRTMLHFDAFSRDNETVTFLVSQAIAVELLLQEKTVVIDDTNLNPKTVSGWRTLAAGADAPLEIIVVDTPVEECIRRDALRTGKEKVGEKVIRDMLARGCAKPYGTRE